MQFKPVRHALLMGMLAMYGQASMADDKAPADTKATAATVPSEVSAKRACVDEKGATKKECEKVATKIDEQNANPEAHPVTEEAHSDADYVHHSSPAVRTPAEIAKDKATAKSDRKTDSSKPAPK
jgi:hypothetical protein